jgi:hypothetical protein
MLDVKNQTPMEVALFPWIGMDGSEAAVVLAKATFDIRSPGGPAQLSELQLPIIRDDQYRGEAASSSLLYASEYCPAKSGTDVVLNGHAYATTRRVKVMDVVLQLGALEKTVRVFGHRAWFRSLGFWKMSAPDAFDRIPLIYERAFGGVDSSENAREPRNPVGTGFAAAGRAEQLEGLALPNLEDPQELIRKWGSRPKPACFGFVAPHWSPRSHYAGTYDEPWKRERFPLLPGDFDERFFSSASHDLVSRPHLRGGEEVRILGASKDGPLVFSLPKWRLTVTTRLRGKRSQHVPFLETVLLEPDEKRVILSWKATVPCPRAFLYLEEVTISYQAVNQ